MKRISVWRSYLKKYQPVLDFGAEILSEAYIRFTDNLHLCFHSNSKKRVVLDQFSKQCGVLHTTLSTSTLAERERERVECTRN